MTEKIRRVVVHGPPDPDEHPWVLERVPSADETWNLFKVDDFEDWHPDTEWYPVPAPPTEYATVEDEGVKVDGDRWRLNGATVEIKNAKSSGWRRFWSKHEAITLARVAQALGLVDQPKVPKALVDWLREWIKDEPVGSQNRMMDLGTLLAMVEAGKFGPVEPSVGRKAQGFCHPGCPDLCSGPPNHHPAPSVEWVTDDEREPTGADLPVYVEWDDGSTDVMRHTPAVPGYRWVSLPVLLDAAGLGER